MLTALITIAVIYGIVRLVQANKRGTKPQLPNAKVPQLPQPTRSIPPAQKSPKLDKETRARVKAQEQAEAQAIVAVVNPAVSAQNRVLEEEIRARVRVQEEAAWGAPVTSTPTAPGVPDSLPLKTKQWFFSQSERAFYDVLVQALPSDRYQVFPNVRLNDLFYITLPPHKRQGTYARLRDKHVDFLIVSLPEFRPVAAIELDGESHDNDQQQYRDAVKDVAFRSAGLPLVRLRAETAHTPASIRASLSAYLQLGRVEA